MNEWIWLHGKYYKNNINEHFLLIFFGKEKHNSIELKITPSKKQNILIRLIEFVSDCFLGIEKRHGTVAVCALCIGSSCSVWQKALNKGISGDANRQRHYAKSIYRTNVASWFENQTVFPGSTHSSDYKHLWTDYTCYCTKKKPSPFFK